jgi:hypothetical protein
MEMYKKSDSSEGIEEIKCEKPHALEQSWVLSAWLDVRECREYKRIK